MPKAENINFYPEASGYGLVNDIADYLEVKPENIVIGNGEKDLYG